MGKIRNRLTATKQKNHLVRLFYNLGSYESLGSGESNKTHKTFQSSLWREIFAIFVSLPGKLFSAYPIPPSLPYTAHPTNCQRPTKTRPPSQHHLPYSATLHHKPPTLYRQLNQILAPARIQTSCNQHRLPCSATLYLHLYYKPFTLYLTLSGVWWRNSPGKCMHVRPTHGRSRTKNKKKRKTRVKRGNIAFYLYFSIDFRFRDSIPTFYIPPTGVVSILFAKSFFGYRVGGS
jgi:hypothetical protein